MAVAIFYIPLTLDDIFLMIYILEIIFYIPLTFDDIFDDI